MKETTCSHGTATFISEVGTKLLENTVNILLTMAGAPRLRILLLSEYNELCVLEISSVIDDKANTISMRLKKLYDADLVSRYLETKHIFIV